MIIPNQITEAISKLLAALYPGTTVYLNNCPKDFLRPSFCIKSVKTTELPANRNAVKIRARFSVTYFAAIDESGAADAGNLLKMQSGIMEIFRKGYVKVGDRNIKVIAKNSDGDADSSCVILRFDYFDDRTNETDSVPLMEEVNFELNKEE